MTAFVARRWSIGKVVFLGLGFLQCARGETPGIDQAPTVIPPASTAGGSGGGGGMPAMTTGGGGNTASGGADANAGAGSAGTGGSGGTGGGAVAGAPAGGAGGGEAAGGAGGDASVGGEGGGGSGIEGGDPYGGTAWDVPGTIEAENFDLGGAGVGYNDTTAGNLGTTYRTTDDVDIEACTDIGGGYDVGWNIEGEWREYTVEVASAGTYSLSARVASPNAGANLRVEVDGTDVTGVLPVPTTGGYQTWQTIPTGGVDVTLSRGIHVMRVVIPASTEFNINWLSFS